jgi:hypothetical protein
MKCVMIIDQNLPVGLIANTAAVLALTIGHRIEGIIGEDVRDGDDQVHAGITQLPIPLLKGDSDLIRSIRERLSEMDSEQVFFVDFCDVAQKSKAYANYKANLEQTPADQLTYLGIAICGPKKQVNGLTGHIGLLR